MGNRKQPFGYEMRFGTVVIQPQEAGLVQYLFRQYILGASFQELVGTLRQQEVPYDAGKLWNKNMVARILENPRYTGGAGDPALIPPEQFQAAAEKRRKKTTPSQKTEAQKLLRRLCGRNITASMESQVLALLNRAVANPQEIQAPVTPEGEAPEATALQSRLEEALVRQPIDEAAANGLALELAAARYDSLGNQAYETERLQHLFRQAEAMEVLDAELLRNAVSAVHIKGHGAVSIQLQNGQILERSYEP